MKKLAVCITTHITGPNGDAGRHGREFRENLFAYYKKMIDRYIDLKAGLKDDDWDLYIMDTGCDVDFQAWAKETEIYNENFYHIGVPNNCGFAAGLKHVMHGNNDLKSKYEYYFFHVDDGVEPQADNWATSLISSYKKGCELGIMGRELITIKLGPNGLTDHHGWCKHVAKMWNMNEEKQIPHLHADWWFMNKATLNKLADVWYEPQYSEAAMQYQKQWENTDFIALQDLNDGRKTLDNIHVGREVDTPLRVELFGGKVFAYKGTKINAVQIHHRGFKI